MCINRNYWLECKFSKVLPISMKDEFTKLMNKWRIVQDKNGNYYGFGSNPKADVFGFAGSLVFIHTTFVPYLKTLNGYINSQTMGLLKEDMLSND